MTYLIKVTVVTVVTVVKVVAVGTKLFFDQIVFHQAKIFTNKKFPQKTFFTKKLSSPNFFFFHQITFFIKKNFLYPKLLSSKNFFSQRYFSHQETFFTKKLFSARNFFQYKLNSFFYQTNVTNIFFSKFFFPL